MSVLRNARALASLGVNGAQFGEDVERALLKVPHTWRTRPHALPRARGPCNDFP